MRSLFASFALYFLIGSAYAAPITIDFDDLSSGTVVGSNYSGLGVTFVDAVTAGYGHLPGGTAPNGIFHTSSSSQPQPSDPIEAIFSSAVSSVSLTGVDVGANGIMLSAFDAVSGGNLLATDQVFGTAAGIGEFFDLGLSVAGIMRVEFSQVRNVWGDGVVFDNFTFDTATTSVPEPASLVLLSLGLVGIGYSRKSRKA